MKRVHYEEAQRFSNVVWIWVALGILLLVPPIMALQDGDSTQQDLIRILLSTAFAFIPVVGTLFFSKLQLKIDDDGIHYKFFPAVLKWRVVSKSTIESVEVMTARTLFERLNCGYRKSRWCNTISMNISGKKIVKVNLKDGWKLKVGTGNPESLVKAVKKLVAPDNL